MKLGLIDLFMWVFVLLILVISFYGAILVDLTRSVMVVALFVVILGVIIIIGMESIKYLEVTKNGHKM